MKQTTIIFPVHNGHVLLGMKKRGFAEGKRNGFGGKLEGLETFIQNAVRELWEEAGIVLSQEQFDLRAVVEFYIRHADTWESELFTLAHVFTVASAEQGQETEEMRPQRFRSDALPLDEMFDWDRARLPELLQSSDYNVVKFKVFYTPEFTFLWYELID